MDYVLFGQVDSYHKSQLNEVKVVVDGLAGDTQLLNNGLYCNYCDTTNYTDFDFKRTAAFLDTLSLAEVQETFVNRTQNYSMK